MDKWGNEASIDIHPSTTGQNFQQDIQETIYQGMCSILPLKIENWLYMYKLYSYSQAHVTGRLKASMFGCL
jgi:hypothetical protein